MDGLRLEPCRVSVRDNARVYAGDLFASERFVRLGLSREARIKVLLMLGALLAGLLAGLVLGRALAEIVPMPEYTAPWAQFDAPQQIDPFP